MKQRLISLMAVGAAALLVGCAQQPRAVDYTAFRASKPHSILVLPPLNNTADLRATPSMSAAVTQPLAEAGYYVFPLTLVDRTFQENGMVLPGQMHEAPLEKLQQIFGADAVLYITVSEYGGAFMVFAHQVKVTANARLVDARSGAELWAGKASIVQQPGNSGGGLIGALVTAVVHQVISANSDTARPLAGQVAQRMFAPNGVNGLLAGPRSPKYEP